MSISGHPRHSIWWLIGFGITQVGIALYHAARFAAQLPVSHLLWSAIVLTEILVIWLIAKRDKTLFVALVLERFVVFSPVLNLIRGKPFFYTSPGGSWLDARMGNLFPVLFGLALAGLLWIEFRHRKK